MDDPQTIERDVLRQWRKIRRHQLCRPHDERGHARRAWSEQLARLERRFIELERARVQADEIAAALPAIVDATPEQHARAAAQIAADIAQT